MVPQVMLSNEAEHLRHQLVAHDWRISATAKGLGLDPSGLYKAIKRHPRLFAEYQKKSPGPGRPRTLLARLKNFQKRK